MMTYNKPYYGRLIELAASTRARTCTPSGGISTCSTTLDPKLLESPAGGRAVQCPSPADRHLEISGRVGDISEHLQPVAGRHLGLRAAVAAEVRHLGAQLKTMIVPELALMAEVEGKPIGAVFGLLDYNPRIKHINGRLFPFGVHPIAQPPREIKRMRVISANVVPEFQRWGIGLVLLKGWCRKSLEWGIRKSNSPGCWKATPSRAAAWNGRAKLSKTYRIYDRSTTRAGPG